MQFAHFLTPLNLSYALIAMNLSAFAAFGIDKARAERGDWRIKESTLLGLAFWGGTPGAYAGRALFRHKTRKQPFVGNLHAIAVLQVVAVIGLIGFTAWRSAQVTPPHPPRQQREQHLAKQPHRARGAAHAAQPRRKAES